jgi:hypothetical protein
MEIKIAGVSYNQVAVRKVKKDQAVKLVEEDSGAIKVMNEDDLLGYIPKDSKSSVLEYLKEHKDYSVIISKVVRWRKNRDDEEQVALRIKFSA